jgi:uncharacterized membrane protein
MGVIGDIGVMSQIGDSWARIDFAGWWDSLSGHGRLLLSSLAFVAALLAGAMVIYLTDRWRRRQGPNAECDANEQMSTFRELYERGELTQEEFDSIRSKLTGRLRQEVEPAEKSAEPTQSEGSPPNVEPPGPPSTPEAGR